MNRICVVFAALAFIGGCNAVGSQSGNTLATLRITSHPFTPDTTVIPVWSASAPDSVAPKILAASLQSDGGAVLLPKVVIAVRSSAPLQSVLADAELAFSGHRYSLSDIRLHSDTTGWLVFSGSRMRDSFIVSRTSRPLVLRAQFHQHASGKHIQASLSSAAVARTLAVQKSDGRRLSAAHKRGQAVGRRYTLQKPGAFIQVRSVSVRKTDPGVRYRVAMNIRAFRTAVSLPWSVHRLQSPSSDFSQAGMYFAIERTDTVIAAGRSQVTLSTHTVHSGFPGSRTRLRIPAGNEQAVTMLIRYRPPTRTRKRKYCLLLPAVKYYTEYDSRLLRLSDATRQCVRM